MEKVIGMTEKESEAIFQKAVSAIVKHPDESLDDFKKRYLQESAALHMAYIGDKPGEGTNKGLRGLLN